MIWTFFCILWPSGWSHGVESTYKKIFASLQIRFYQKRFYLKQLRSYEEKTFYSHPFGATEFGHDTKKDKNKHMCLLNFHFWVYFCFPFFLFLSFFGQLVNAIEFGHDTKKNNFSTMMKSSNRLAGWSIQ